MGASVLHPVGTVLPCRRSDTKSPQLQSSGLLTESDQRSQVCKPDLDPSVPSSGLSASLDSETEQVLVLKTGHFASDCQEYFLNSFKGLEATFAAGITSGNVNSSMRESTQTSIHCPQMDSNDLKGG